MPNVHTIGTVLSNPQKNSVVINKIKAGKRLDPPRIKNNTELKTPLTPYYYSFIIIIVFF